MRFLLIRPVFDRHAADQIDIAVGIVSDGIDDGADIVHHCANRTESVGEVSIDALIGTGDDVAAE